MCDPGDIAAIFDVHSPHTRLPTVTIYELTPGGTGLCEELMLHHAELLPCLPNACASVTASEISGLRSPNQRGAIAQCEAGYVGIGRGVDEDLSVGPNQPFC